MMNFNSKVKISTNNVIESQNCVFNGFYNTKNTLMKNMILMFIAVMISCSYVMGQDTKALYTKGLSTTNGVYLRWLPEDMVSWKKGNNLGYQITRYHIGTNTQTFEAEAAYDSEVVIAGSVMPLLESGWNTDFPNNDKAGIIRDALHNTNLDYVPSPNRNLYDAIQHNEYEESKFFVTSIICEQDFDIAKGAGLGFVDATAQPNQKYRYIVSLNVDADSLIAFGGTEVLYTGTLNLPDVTDLSGKGSDRTATLGWEIRSNKEDYSFYNIERSDDGGNTFTTVNSEPFIFASEVEEDPEFAYFQDSLDQNNFTYIYRVRGLSPFGFEGPLSDTIHVVGKPPKLSVELEINDLEFVTADELVLHWSNMDDSLNQHFTHYNVLRLLDIQGEIEQINTSPIDKINRSFTITDAPTAAYYKLEAYDVNGHRYRSIAYLGQSPDTEPPAMPTGLEGSVYQDGTIDLEWSPNTEDDLLGYKVFYSNVKTSEYSQWTNDVVKETSYTTKVSTEVATDSIYISILAVDKRYNFSERTAPIALKRPDVHPPSSPVLSFLLPREEGVRIAFQPSSSSDVDHHEVQRRIKGTNNWNTLLNFTPANEPQELPLVPGETMASRYIDVDSLALRYYDYRIVAVDGNNNISSSAIRTVKPYDDGIRGDIVDIRAFLIDDPRNPTVGTGGAGGTAGTNAANKVVQLLWQYETKFPLSLREFKVYYKEEEGTSGSAIGITTPRWVLIKTVSKHEAEGMAQEFGAPGNMWIHRPTLPSPLKYKYKVVAHHNDGGFSLESAEVEAFLPN